MIKLLGGFKVTIKIMLSLIILLILISLAIVYLGLTSQDRSVIFQKYKTYDYQSNQRQYLISAPKTVNESTRIIIGLHGFGDSARKFAYYTGLHNAAHKSDIVVYPQAIKPEAGQRNGWNAGFCCGSGWIQKTDDVGFITSLAQSIQKNYNLKGSKFYVTGFSNGAFMSQRIATDKPESVAALAIMSGSIGTTSEQLKPKRPVPILLMHGQLDKTVPINGGTKLGEPDFEWLPLSTTEKAWQQVNAKTAAVKVITEPDIGHQWADWRILSFWHRQSRASRQVVNFFNNQSKD